MTIEELIAALVKAEEDNRGDFESIHSTQDDLLLAYINDHRVTEIFYRTTKWYA